MMRLPVALTTLLATVTALSPLAAQDGRSGVSSLAPLVSGRGHGFSVQLGHPVRTTEPVSETAASSRVGLGRPAAPGSEIAKPIQQVSLSQPVGRNMVRAQNNDAATLLHAPMPVVPQSPQYSPSPSGPTATSPLAPLGQAMPAGPVLGAPPAPEGYAGLWSSWLGGWFDGWFGEEGWLAGHPAPVLPLKGLSFGGGVYLLYPHWENNPAYAVTTGPGVARFRQEDFSFHTEVAPYAYISYTSPTGLGLRSRFWRFDQTSTIFLQNDGLSQIDSAAPLNLQNTSFLAGDQLMFEGGLQITVIDLEALQVFNWGLWSLQFSGGVRYSHLAQHYNHLRVPAAGSFDAITSGHNFRGAGPTLGIEARRDLGFWGLGLYGSARGSLLYGTGRQNAFLVGSGSLVATASASRSDVIPVTELELGLDWCKQIKQCRFFVQAAVVGQVWYGAGNAANNEMILPVGQGFLGNVADNNANLGLFGGKLVFGLEF